MTNKKSTKRALITSALAMLMCVAMLIGTTFAWFTDTASTAVNKIQSGKLDVDIQDGSGNSLDGKTLSFKDVNGNADILWEPGATFNLDSFKIVNKGNLALKYKVIVNGVDGNTKLLEAIDFTAKIGDSTTTVELGALEGKIVPAGKTPGDGEVAGETGLITISGTMKTTAGNEYQGLSIDGIGITVVATQYTYEYDSNGKTYDEEADTTIQVNTDNIQDYLDGKYGTIDGATLVLAAGEYDKLVLGRATKYPGSNTTYRVNSYDNGAYETAALTLEQLKTATIQSRYYLRTMSNITFKPAAEATVSVAGIEMVSDVHSYDYVMDEEKDHHEAIRAYNITFEDITFTAKCNIDGLGCTATVINGFTFKDCKFNINNTSGIDYQAIRYGCNGNATVQNLVVDGCEFSNCYQGIYTYYVSGVTVKGSTFDTTKHNAIAFQINDAAAPFNHGAVVITNNTFNNIGDRIIRFNKVGADTQITIRNNTATNSGDSDGQVIKANSLASGIKYDISGNTWGEGKTVANTEFADK